MTSTVDTPLRHPIEAFARTLGQGLDNLTDVPVWSMSATEKRDVIVDLARQRDRLDELWLRVLAEGDRVDLAAETAATSTAAWLATATTRPVAATQADVKLARAVDDDFEATRKALTVGGIDVEQARVITRAVQTLPAEAIAADATLTRRAEQLLLELAMDHDAVRLRRLARHLLDVLDPDAADERLGRQLEREEEHAARSTFLQLHDNGDGTHAGRFKIGTLHAAMLTKALEAFTNPAFTAGSAREAAGPDGEVATCGPVLGNPASVEPAATPSAVPRDRSAKRSRPELLGQALCSLLERMPADRLPHQGGASSTVVVLVDYDTLLTGLGTARLDTGERLSGGQARRLACEAGVIPAVIRRLVDGRSVVLDMGRKRRLHTEHMRIALAIEQGGCTAEHCDRPPGWCDAHHDLPWAHGGGTSVENGRLLCPFHHRTAHSSRYDTQRLPSGKVRFHRRT